jgi:hypothetical protein
MTNAPNTQIGTVICPHRDCNEVCKVYRFRPRSENSRRFAGKVYAMCPVHGRYGEGGKPATQEWIHGKGEIWGANGPPPPAADPAPVAAPAAAPAQQPAPPASGWKTLLG